MMISRVSEIEAFTRRDRITSGLTSVMRDQRNTSSSSSSSSSRNRRETLLGISNCSSSTIHRSASDELREEDLWEWASSDLDEYSMRSRERTWLTLDNSNFSSSSSSSSSRFYPTAAHRIPQTDSSAGKIKKNSMLQQSAPMNVPDWSQILKTSNITKQEKGFLQEGKVEEEDEEDGDDEEKSDSPESMPPHKLVERKFAKNQRTAFSVYEGVGRTLKGRDLSRVRSAVWQRTGFLGV